MHHNTQAWNDVIVFLKGLSISAVKLELWIKENNILVMLNLHLCMEICVSQSDRFGDYKLFF